MFFFPFYLFQGRILKRKLVFILSIYLSFYLFSKFCWVQNKERVQRNFNIKEKQSKRKVKLWLDITNEYKLKKFLTYLVQSNMRKFRNQFTFISCNLIFQKHNILVKTFGMLLNIFQIQNLLYFVIYNAKDLFFINILFLSPPPRNINTSNIWELVSKWKLVYLICFTRVFLHLHIIFKNFDTFFLFQTWWNH